MRVYEVFHEKNDMVTVIVDGIEFFSDEEVKLLCSFGRDYEDNIRFIYGGTHDTRDRMEKCSDFMHSYLEYELTYLSVKDAKEYLKKCQLKENDIEKIINTINLRLRDLNNICKKGGMIKLNSLLQIADKKIKNMSLELNDKKFCKMVDDVLKETNVKSLMKQYPVLSIFIDTIAGQFILDKRVKILFKEKYQCNKE